jgi:hypothetical protein
METFYVQLRDCPEIPVEAPDKFSAMKAYLKFCGILSTVHPVEVLSEAEMDQTPELQDRKLRAERLAADRRWNCRAT